MAQNETSYSPRHLRAEHGTSRGKSAPKLAAARSAAKRGEAARVRRAAAAEQKNAPDREPVNADLFEKSLLPMVENVHRLDQTSLRVGVTWLLLLPSGLKMSTRLNFAITMNARGGPGIVLATVAYSYNIISLEFFTVLILTTMLSSMIAGYYLRLQQKKDAKIFNEL